MTESWNIRAVVTLVRIHIEAPGQLRERCIAFERRQDYPRLERR